MGYERHDPRYRRGPSGYRPDQDQDRYRSDSYDRGRDDHYRESRYRGAPSGYDYKDRGFFDRAGDEVRSWFGDEEAERRRRQDEREYERRYGRPAARGYADSYRAGGYGYVGGYGAGNPAYGGYDLGAPTAYAPYAGGTYRENNRQHDPLYREWRDRQVESLDRDFDDYRREHQSRFEQDFGSWRQTRQTKRESLSRVQEHQEVVGSDGSHVGTVDKVRGDRIILTKTDKDAGGHHHSIPLSWVNRIEDKVELNVTAEHAKSVWKDEERRGAIGGDHQSYNGDGPHVLNRSFSGTY